MRGIQSCYDGIGVDGLNTAVHLLPPQLLLPNTHPYAHTYTHTDTHIQTKHTINSKQSFCCLTHTHRHTHLHTDTDTHTSVQFSPFRGREISSVEKWGTAQLEP